MPRHVEVTGRGRMGARRGCGVRVGACVMVGARGVVASSVPAITGVAGGQSARCERSSHDERTQALHAANIARGRVAGEAKSP
jgi:serine acetyltransferase